MCEHIQCETVNVVSGLLSLGIHYVPFKSQEQQAGEMAQQLKTYTAPSVDPSLVPSTHMRQPPIVHLPGIQALFLVLKCSSVHTYTQIHIYTLFSYANSSEQNKVK